MTQRTWPMVMLLLMSLGVGLFLLREPLFKPYAERRDEIAKLQDELGEARSKLSETRAAVRRRAESWSGYGDPLDAAAQIRRASDWARRLETIALGAGLKVVTLQPKRERIDDQGVIAFPLTVTLSGDEQGLVRFLSQIQSLRGVVGIERLVVRRQSRGEQSLSVQASIVNYGVMDAERREALAAERAAAERKKSA